MHTYTHSQTLVIPQNTLGPAEKLGDASFGHFDPKGLVLKTNKKVNPLPGQECAYLDITDSFLTTTPRHTVGCHHYNAGR
jgi:hypothetical protein